MENNKLRGLGVAMVTPFNDDESIDYPALEKLSTFLIDGGVDYLVVQGTTGESPVLSKEEKQKVLNTVCKINNGRLPIVFGIGGNNTRSVVEDLKSYDLSQVDALLSVSPYYSKPTQEGIYQHYKLVASNTELPIILYNVPGRTSSNVQPATTIRLANDFKNIIAVKEASGSMEQIMEIIQTKPEGFLVISGDDAITLPILACGGDGVISVVGNGLPAPFKKMVSAALNENMDQAKTEHYRVLPIIKHLFSEGNPAGIKEVLADLGIMSNKLRMPLVNVSSETKSKIITIARNINKG